MNFSKNSCSCPLAIKSTSEILHKRITGIQAQLRGMLLYLDELNAFFSFNNFCIKKPLLQHHQCENITTEQQQQEQQDENNEKIQYSIIIPKNIGPGIQMSLRTSSRIEINDDKFKNTEQQETFFDKKIDNVDTTTHDNSDNKQYDVINSFWSCWISQILNWNNLLPEQTIIYLKNSLNQLKQLCVEKYNINNLYTFLNEKNKNEYDHIYNLFKNDTDINEIFIHHQQPL